MELNVVDDVVKKILLHRSTRFRTMQQYTCQTTRLDCAYDLEEFVIVKHFLKSHYDSVLSRNCQHRHLARVGEIKKGFRWKFLNNTIPAEKSRRRS
jgi:hypothetical protein